MVASNGQLPQIRQLQRTLAAQGWDPRDIAREIYRRFPGVSRFASWRYGYGWSSQRACDEIRRHYRLPPGSRRGHDYIAGIDVTRLNEWEHWPHSGVRPGLLYLEAASRAYQVSICELGLDDGYHQPAASSEHAAIPMTPAAHDPVLLRTAFHQAAVASPSPLACRFAVCEQVGGKLLRGWAFAQFQLCDAPSQHESPDGSARPAESHAHARDPRAQLPGVGVRAGRLVHDPEGAVRVAGLTVQLSQAHHHDDGDDDDACSA